MKLLTENDPILHEISSDWDFEIDGDPSELIRNMAKIMLENNGIGLAAPQIGISKNIFVMGNETKLVACINPSILFLSSSDNGFAGLEGCLSFPDLFMKVKRPEFCAVEYYTISGEKIEKELTGIEARVFQHELDHLRGITFDSRVGSVILKLAKERRKKKK